MLSERARDSLRDVRDNIVLVEEFVSGMDFAGFQRDAKTRYAVLYALLVVSEASRRLPAEIKRRHAGIAWRDMADAGNVYRHDYHAISPPMVWKTVRDGLAALKKAVDRELAGT